MGPESGTYSPEAELAEYKACGWQGLYDLSSELRLPVSLLREEVGMHLDPSRPGVYEVVNNIELVDTDMAAKLRNKFSLVSGSGQPLIRKNNGFKSGFPARMQKNGDSAKQPDQPEVLLRKVTEQGRPPEKPVAGNMLPATTEEIKPRREPGERAFTSANLLKQAQPHKLKKGRLKGKEPKARVDYDSLTIDDLRSEERSGLIREKIYNFCFSLFKGQENAKINAENLAHDAYIKALINSHQFRNERSLLPWLYRISRNLFVDMIRRNNTNEKPDRDHFKAGRLISDDGEELFADQSTVNGEGIGKLLAHRELIRLIKGSLTPEQSRLFNLRFEQGCGEEKTAEIMGIPVGTVKSRTSRLKEDIIGRYKSYL